MRLLELIQKLWPRKLSKQLVVVNALTYSITIVGFASYSAHQQNIDKIKVNNWQIERVAQDIAEVSVPFIINNKLQALVDNLLSLQFATNTNIESITIRATTTNRQITLTRKSKSKFQANIAVFSGNQSMATFKNNNILNPQLRKAIFNEKNFNSVPIGWVQIIYNLDSIKLARTKVLKNSLTVAVLAILFSLIVLRILLMRLMRALRKAAEFAEWLDLAQGGQVEVDHCSQEIEFLARSLNRTAKKIYLHEGSQRIANTLLDAIREIQTQYISEFNSPRLYENLLSKIVQLTGSEIGFIGESMITSTNKQYLKIHSISHTEPGGKFEQFMKKNSPNNMEFHNIQNLFGTVLQTKKPAIANDPENDPRSGGLPDGHPVLHSFLGLPIFYGGELVGMAGVSNRRKDYDQGVVAYVQPLLSTIGHIIYAARMRQKKAFAQDALRDSTVRFATILSTVADGVLTFESNGLIDTINPAVVKIFGYQHDDVIGEDINYLIPELYNTSVGKFSNLSLLEKIDMAEVTWNTQGRRKDGCLFPIEITVNKFVWSGTKEYTLTLRDITKMKKFEETKDAIVTTMFNELLTPLTSIRGSLNLVKQQTKIDVPRFALSNVENAFNNTGKLLLLINNFIEFEHIEAGEFKINSAPIELIEFLHKVSQANQSLAEEVGVKLNFKPTSEKIWLYADSERLMQVMSNILLSAVNYSAKDTVIDIIIRRFDGKVRIAITDQSIGIPEALKQKGSGKLSRIERLTQNDVSSAVLGLSISKTIIEKHGGTLHFESKVVESKKHRGTHYYIDLPVLLDKSIASNM